jgi:hypothetical protein
MSLVIAQVGMQDALKRLLNTTNWNDTYVLHLYSACSVTSNTNPTEGAVAGSFTEVSTSSTGYASVTCTRGSWTVSAVSTYYQAAYAQQTFNWSGAGCPVTVFGYYFTETTSGDLAWMECIFTGSGQTFNSGDVFKLTPQIAFGNGTPS